ncbi:hypothetical protein ACJ3XI_08345 [Litorimonas sp. RW-G-Af-16]|uniref:hypothetical protein n=1 Tax=Litorimonas sp. RW-G-Af-16 TaxID=3241168 RepID=UPI00390CD94F
MLYYRNRPVKTHRPSSVSERFFQWRSFDSKSDDILIQEIEATFEHVKTETRTEEYFLLPGRRNVMPRMIDNETFEVRSLLNDNEPIELWERSVKTKFPMKRSVSARIGCALPKLRASFNSVATPDSLSEALQRKSKYYKASKTRRLYQKGKMTAEISTLEIDGETQTSVAIQCIEKEPISRLVKKLKLKKADNTNFVDYLLAS